MSVTLDESFEEPPSVVTVVLAHAIEAAGWRLVHVSPTADLLVWEVLGEGQQPATLHAAVSAEGDGAHVRVTAHHAEGAPPPTGLKGRGRTATVLPFRPRPQRDEGPAAR